MKKITEIKDSEGNVIRRRVQTVPVGASLVEQSHRDECNINSIMSRYYKTGLVPSRGMPGHYGDFSDCNDYHTAVTRVMEAEDAFLRLPSQIRRQFDNDPAQLLAFLADDKNRDKAMELGIIPEPIIPEPLQVIVTNPEAENPVNNN